MACSLLYIEALYYSNKIAKYMKKTIKKILNISKKIVIYIGIVCVLALVIFRPKNKGLEVVFLDVGQGDASLILTPDKQTILIDGGPDNKVLQGLGKNLSFYRRKIDYLIISHYHDDHIIGSIEIFKRYRVKNLVYSGKESDSMLMSELLKIASEQGAALSPLESQARISLGRDCLLSILNPAIFEVKDDPNNSLVSRLDCDQKSFLFAGDNGTAVEKVLITSNWPLKADIFKASHHGSNTSNSEDFLRAVAPDSIVVSVGEDNRFGHPGGYFLDRAGALGIPVFRTDYKGDFKIHVK